MILIYLKADGQARAEFIKHSSKFIELPDGYHPMLDKGVMRDSEHKYPAVMFIWQNRPMPEGCDDTRENNEVILVENELIKMGRGRPSISKLFYRRLLSWLFNVARWFYFGFALMLFLILLFAFAVVVL